MSYDAFSPVTDNSHSSTYPPRDPETGKFVPIGDHMNPISEAEMKEFFARFATNFVEASRQAQQLKELQAQVHDLITKVESLASDNSNLRAEVASTYEFVRELETENTKLKAELETERKRNEAQAERINVLHSDIENIQLELNSVRQNYKDALTEVTNIRATNDSLSSELTNARYDVDYWRKQYHTVDQVRMDVERDNRTLRDELKRYKDGYAALQAVISPPEQVTEFRQFG